MEGLRKKGILNDGQKRISKCCSANNKNKGFLCKPSLFLFCKQLQRTNRAQDHSSHYLAQYFENIGLTTEQSDWLILVIGPLATSVV